MLARSLPAHSIGGLEDHTLELSKGLVRIGADVAIISTRHPKGLEHEVLEGVKIHYLKNSSSGSYLGGFWPTSVEKVKELHAQSPFDLIHSQSLAAYYLLKNRVHLELDLPVVISMHGTTVDEIATQFRLIREDPLSLFGYLGTIVGKIRQYLCVERPTLSRATAVIATSNEQAELIKKFYPLKPEKIFKVFNGANLKMFSPSPKPLDLLRKHNFSEREKIILAAARLELEKGVQYLIRALPLVIKDLPEARLLILGEGSYKNILQKLASKMRLNRYITFGGSVNLTGLPAYFNLCDVFVNATVRQNGYDLTCLEAMACEKPVIVSDLGSMPTLISNNQDGILVPPADVKSIAKSIVGVLSDKTLAQALGKKARIKAEKDFRQESMVERTEQVYEAVAAGYGR
jgi:glycosyltransferase involved in cell wall biosynthesis